MTQEQIKAEVEYRQFKMKRDEIRITELRGMCTHENTFENNYSYRVGHISPAIICSDCGILIRYISERV